METYGAGHAQSLIGQCRSQAAGPAATAGPAGRPDGGERHSSRAPGGSLAGERTGSRPASGVPAAPPAMFDVTAGGLQHRLTPGMRAARDLSAMTSKHFSTQTPCCGRRITLPMPGQDQTWPAVCCYCHALFEVALFQEEPDGFGGEPPHIAIFVVNQADVAVARHRAGKWERHRHQQRSDRKERHDD